MEFKHKKLEQALGLSLRRLFEQLAGVLRQLRCLLCATLSFPDLGCLRSKGKSIRIDSVEPYLYHQMPDALVTNVLVIPQDTMYGLRLLCEFVKTKFNELANLCLVVRVGCLVVAMSNDAAYCTCIMTKVSSNTCNC